MERRRRVDRTAGNKKTAVPALFKVFLTVLFGFCATVFIQQEISIYQIEKEQAATVQRLADLKKQKSDLLAERKRLDDPKYIERLARDDYNMVGSNEIPLFVVDRNQK